MSKKITKCDVRMYRMGTGDCFVLSFRSKEKVEYRLMIDCGVQQIKGEDMDVFAEEIIEQTGGEVDALLITHEHSDHVLGFQRSKKKFTGNFKIKELWLPWTENEKDKRVKEWKKEYGKKKRALAMATNELNKRSSTESYKKIYGAGKSGTARASLDARAKINDALTELTALNTELLTDGMLGAAGDYIGGLKGMEIVKNDIVRAKKEIRYLETGSILEDIDGLDNIRIYILGPPAKWKNVKHEKKSNIEEGETYEHNKHLDLVKSFSSLPFGEEGDMNMEEGPFDPIHYSKGRKNKVIKSYEAEENTFRRIDHDWLMSAANLSLRLTKGINNLSAVLAIEFVESGKVMLFPGDAEYESWRSWHDIPWPEKAADGVTHLTEDLLNRTVFYKVAHHLSHNGTARREGLDMMKKDLVAMATLDYEVISSTWKNTMPNKHLIKDLLEKTKGKLIITNQEGLKNGNGEFLTDEIEEKLNELSEAQWEVFSNNFTPEDLYFEFTVDGE